MPNRCEHCHYSCDDDCKIKEDIKYYAKLRKLREELAELEERIQRTEQTRPLWEAISYRSHNLEGKAKERLN